MSKDTGRTGSGRFAPGVSGNPTGRPKADGFLRDLAREHTEEAWRTIIDSLGSEDAKIRLRAAELVLERGYGKAPQSLEAKMQVEQDPANAHLAALLKGTGGGDDVPASSTSPDMTAASAAFLAAVTSRPS